ncbi:adenylate cyclase [Mesorhizobium sp. ANAO-SY3R2]|uniref:adenylate cyclase n=1 Tax=Mesorhizobium sp. ANAO-SY3R2 TaxID=3166644 RepID=UPI00366F50D7
MRIFAQTAALAAAPAVRPPPSQEEIRVQLERILSSPEFAVPARGCAFLRYVVEETLAGRSAWIKGYTIAIEVFGRDETFTQDDPVVRIEAGRLRRALERYYLVSGQDDPIRIDIPKGGYVPLFTWNADNPEEAALAETTAMAAISSLGALSRQRARWLLPAASLFLAGFLVVAYWMSGLPMSGAPLSSTSLGPEGPTLAILPFEDLGEGRESRLYALGLTEELLSALPRFREITVFGHETSDALTPQVAASNAGEKPAARYLLAGGVQVSGGRVRITARLLETATGAILWSQTYDEDLRTRDLFAIQSDVAARVATVVAQPYGVIAQADAANPPPDDLDAYRCTLQFYAYRADLNAARHLAVRDCLERAIVRFPTYATAWSMLSIAYLDEDRFDFNPRPGTPAALERALTTAQRAVELDARNIRALQALMTALFFNHQLLESTEVGDRALALNPNDTELIAEFGTRLALGGQWQRGAQLLHDALARNPGASGYHHAMLAFSAYMLENDVLALAEIRQASLDALPLFHLVAAVIYAQSGMMDEATREGQQFVSKRPDFLPNIETELAKRNIRGKDRTRMIAGIRKAGLPLPSDIEASASPP